MKSKGFTLIELLVVIAIIGILAAVTLSSLNTARDKGKDAAIKATLANMRAEAELYYDDNGGTYAASATSDVCTSGTGPGDIFAEADAVDVVAAGACNAAAGAWAAYVPLASVTTSFFCVDSQGAGEVLTAAPASGATAC